MSNGWRNPGAPGRCSVRCSAAVVGVVVTMFSRLALARHAAGVAQQRLPDGPIIVIANHTSYADGVLLALLAGGSDARCACSPTSGVFRAPFLGRLVSALGFIPVAVAAPTPRSPSMPRPRPSPQGRRSACSPKGGSPRSEPLAGARQDRRHAPGAAVRRPIVPVAMVGAHEVVGRDGSLRLVKNLVCCGHAPTCWSATRSTCDPRRRRRPPITRGGASRRRPRDG